MSKEIKVEVKSEEEAIKALGGTKEVYPFAFEFEFVAGTGGTEARYRQCPVTFSVKHLVSNLHEMGIATLLKLHCANVSALLGDGIDLCSLPSGDDPILGYPVSFPWMSPANQFMLTVGYNGKIPANMKFGEKFKIVVTLIGEARIVQ